MESVFTYFSNGWIKHFTNHIILILIMMWWKLYLMLNLFHDFYSWNFSPISLHYLILYFFLGLGIPNFYIYKAPNAWHPVLMAILTWCNSYSWPWHYSAYSFRITPFKVQLSGWSIYNTFLSTHELSTSIVIFSTYPTMNYYYPL